MSPIESHPARPKGEVDAGWTSLYRTGGVAAALLVAVTIVHSSVFFVVGLPDDVVGWFALFDDNPLGG